MTEHLKCAIQNTQEAPFPDALDSLVQSLRYKPGWRIALEDKDRGQRSSGLTLAVYITEPDTYHPDETMRVVHYFIVPAAAYDARSWRRWLFERLLDVEKHECMEFFRFVSSGMPDDCSEYRPYAPHHGPGNDPYAIFEHAPDVETRTSYLGVERPEHDPASEV